jgi:hypothetical protein
MIANYVCLFVALVIVARQYARGYADGLACTIFLCVILPESLALRLGPGLPTFSIHRLTVLLTLWHWYKNPEIDRRAKGAPFYRVLLLATICFFVSSLLSSFFLVSIKRYFYFFVEFFLLFIVIQTSAGNRLLGERITRAVGQGLLVVAVLGIIERYTGYGIAQLFPYDSAGYDVDRFSWINEGSAVTVSYRHRILFGVACAIGTLKYLVDAALYQEKGPKRKSLLFAFVCGAALYFSNSRGPWLSFLVGSLIFVGCMPGRFLKPALILAAVAVAVMIVRPGVWVTINGLAESTTDAESIKGSSFQWRRQIFEFGLQKITHSDPAHFLFGYGGGSTIMTDFGKITIASGESLPLESWDCEAAVLLYERGFVGLLLSVILFFGMLISAFFYLRRGNRETQHTMAFVCVTMSVICFMLSNVAIYTVQLIYIEAIALGIGSRLLQQQKSISRPLTATPSSDRFAHAT